MTETPARTGPGRPAEDEGGVDARADAAARRVMAGDAAAFRTLVDETTPPLYRLALRLAGTPDDAKDVLQTAYLAAYQALAKGRFDGRASVRTWLYRIVVNQALNRRRSERRAARDLPFALPAVALGPGAEDVLLLTRVARWLSELPPEQRVCLVLKEVEGLTTAEIAEMLGSTIGAVEQRVFRARKTLRERLDHG